MTEYFMPLFETINFSETKFNKIGLKEIVQNYTFLFISKNTNLQEETKQKIIKNIENSRLIIFDENDKFNKGMNEKYLIIGFEKTIIILDQSLLPFFYNLCSFNTSLLFINLAEQNPNDKILLIEIENFNKHCRFMATKAMTNIWSLIFPCIYGYLIKKSYLELNNNRIQQYIIYMENESSTESMSNNEYVNLRTVGKGSLFECTLIYHIKHGKLYVIKKAYTINSEISKLENRESSNYMKVCHPFLPKYYGKVFNENYSIIEFINGKTLENITEINLAINEKINIIFELMLVFKYFRDNGLIYRDLKPNNIMINENKAVVLIDLDRLIENDSIFEHTLDLPKTFLAPEINYTKKFTYETDIYSLGKIIEYIIADELQSSKSDNRTLCLKIEEIIRKCTDKKPENRPSIYDLIREFNSLFQSKIQLESKLAKYEEHYNNIEKICEMFKMNLSKQNNPEVQFYLGFVYQEGHYVAHDIDKAIYYFSQAANQNYPQAQFKLGKIYSDIRDVKKSIQYYSLAADQNIPQAQYNLGIIYYSGKHVVRDVKKAVHYFLLASDNNIPQAQLKLGYIYLTGQYVQKDIQQAIHFLTLASNHNMPQAQFNLAQIYYEGRDVPRDINKVIHYYELASDLNLPLAQFNLGRIYHEGKYIQCDINKAIHYYSLAADNDIPEAQYNLGCIYSTEQYAKININSAIHYFVLASDHNFAEAQFKLGVIFHNGKYISCDITKAIHFYSLAANQNVPEAQYNLGVIYLSGKHIKRDIEKAIYFFMLASNQNVSLARLNLGLIFDEGKYVKRDINKAIYYYSLAASQYLPEAQFNLGSIYLTEQYIMPDINKAIYYYTLASNQEYPEAQFNLGVIYLLSNNNLNIKKAIFFILLASKNGNKQANFSQGFLHHEGKYIDKDIRKAINFYKEASSFNNQYAKNNLGIIFKNGYTNEIEKRVANAISYFDEAIRQKNDYLSMYNLAHIYIYDETVDKTNDRSVDLLIKSSYNFKHSQILLCLVLVRKFGFRIESIKQAIFESADMTEDLSNKIFRIIYDLKLLHKTEFDHLYESYRTKDFLYNIVFEPIQSSSLQNIINDDNSKYPNAKDITPVFYEGFNISL